jgi:hypothetical protein
MNHWIIPFLNDVGIASIMSFIIDIELRYTIHHIWYLVAIPFINWIVSLID